MNQRKKTKGKSIPTATIFLNQTAGAISLN